MLNVLDEVKSIAANKLFISVAMGITIKQMENILPSTSRVIRVMPNTPALVNQGKYQNEMSLVRRNTQSNNVHDFWLCQAALFMCEVVMQYKPMPI